MAATSFVYWYGRQYFSSQAEESWNGWKDLQAWTNLFHFDLVWANLSWFYLVRPQLLQVHPAEVSLGRFGLIFAIWADLGWFDPAAHPSHWQKMFKLRTLGEGYSLATSVCQSNLVIVIKIKTTDIFWSSNTTPSICITEMRMQAWKGLCTKHFCWQHCSW